MNRFQKISGKGIIFSKWSRKKYAAFASLKKVIKITRLSVDICNASLKKQLAVWSVLINYFPSSLIICDVDENEPLFSERILLETVICSPKADNPYDLALISKRNNTKSIIGNSRQWTFLFYSNDRYKRT